MRTNRRRKAAVLFRAPLLAFLVACSNSTGPGNTTHPDGTVAGAPAIASRPFAVAISAHDIAYVGRQDLPFLQATPLPDTGFGDSVRVGSDPTDIAFNASGSTAYVTNQFSSNVGIITVAAGVSTDSVAVPGNPFRILVAPNGTQVYVSTNVDSVYAIAVSSKTFMHRWGFPAPVNGMALSANGGTLWVSTIGGELFRLNTSGLGPVDTVFIGGVLQDVALSPDESELYVANETGSLTVRNPTTLAAIDSVPGAAGAFGLKSTPDGVQLYATYPGAGLIKIIDVAGRTVGPTLVVGGTPRRIAFNQEGTIALVPNEAGFVSVIR